MEGPSGSGSEGGPAPTFWQQPTGPRSLSPVSRRRYVVAVLLGAIVVISSAAALFDWFQVDAPVLPAFPLGIFAAGWNTKARTLGAWIVVGLLTSATAIVIGYVVLSLA